MTAGTGLGQTRGATNPRGRRAGEEGALGGCFTNRTKKLERDVVTGESSWVVRDGSWWERGLELRAALQLVLNPVPFTPHVQGT